MKNLERLKMNLNNIEQSIKSLEEETNSLKGKVSLLEQQYSDNVEKLSELEELSETNTKAIELLNFVQKATKEKIKDTFEIIISKALNYIYQSNEYGFELEFGRRGAIPELNFNIKRPELQGSHNILDTSAGGSRDVVAIALRFVLLEVAKLNGFLFLDEIEKRLDNPETMDMMIQFLKKTQQSSGRQLLIISHKQEFVDMADNVIETKPVINISVVEHTDVKLEEKPKKKRGRPKKKEKK